MHFYSWQTTIIIINIQANIFATNHCGEEGAEVVYPGQAEVSQLDAAGPRHQDVLRFQVSEIIMDNDGDNYNAVNIFSGKGTTLTDAERTRNAGKWGNRSVVEMLPQLQ